MAQNLYTFLFYPLLWLVFYILRFIDPKIKLGFELRKSKNISPFSFSDTTSPVIWFHVASGELEYAKPVIREIKKSFQCLILVTYFSPSVRSSLQNMKEVDYFLPMPWDTPWHWSKFLKDFKPKALAIARTDLWPNMIWQTSKFKIPIVLFSATLPSHSGRVASFWGRLFYSLIIEKINLISCVSDEDKNNFQRIFPDAKVQVDGDTRFDQVLFRLELLKERKNEQIEWIRTVFLKNQSGQRSKIFVAGSTWPEDEEVVISAISSFNRQINKANGSQKLPGKAQIKFPLKFIVTPHEVHSSAMSSLTKKLNLSSIPHLLLSQIFPENGPDKKPYVTENNPDVLIVDKVGLLAELYSLADLAFVGGSFKKSVHSVMEPLAAGVFTLFGPFHHNNREALLFKKLGLAREVIDSKSLEEELNNLAAISDETLGKQSLEIKSKVSDQSCVSQKVAKLIASNHLGQGFRA